MSRRLSLLSLLLLSAWSGSASADWWETDNPPDVRGGYKLQDLRLQGKISGFKVKSTHGRTVTVTLPRSGGLDQPIALPKGEWAEITLILDGPLTLSAGGVTQTLQVHTLTVPLEDPEATQVHLDWTLPEGLGLDGDAAALISALEDGALARP